MIKKHSNKNPILIKAILESKLRELENILKEGSKIAEPINYSRKVKPLILKGNYKELTFKISKKIAENIKGKVIRPNLKKM